MLHRKAVVDRPGPAGERDVAPFQHPQSARRWTTMVLIDGDWVEAHLLRAEDHVKLLHDIISAEGAIIPAGIVVVFLKQGKNGWSLVRHASPRSGTSMCWIPTGELARMVQMDVRQDDVGGMEKTPAKTWRAFSRAVERTALSTVTNHQQRNCIADGNHASADESPPSAALLTALQACTTDAHYPQKDHADGTEDSASTSAKQGPGIELYDATSRATRIRRIVPGSPAALCGKLALHDQIVSVDHVSCIDLEASKVMRMLQGVENSLVHLLVRTGVENVSSLHSVWLLRTDTGKYKASDASDGSIGAVIAETEETGAWQVDSIKRGGGAWLGGLQQMSSISHLCHDNCLWEGDKIEMVDGVSVGQLPDAPTVLVGRAFTRVVLCILRDKRQLFVQVVRSPLLTGTLLEVAEAYRHALCEALDQTPPSASRIFRAVPQQLGPNPGATFSVQEQEPLTVLHTRKGEEEDADKEESESSHGGFIEVEEDESCFKPPYMPQMSTPLLDAVHRPNDQRVAVHASLQATTNSICQDLDQMLEGIITPKRRKMLIPGLGNGGLSSFDLSWGLTLQSSPPVGQAPHSTKRTLSPGASTDHQPPSSRSPQNREDDDLPSPPCSPPVVGAATRYRGRDSQTLDQDANFASMHRVPGSLDQTLAARIRRCQDNCSINLVRL